MANNSKVKKIVCGINFEDIIEFNSISNVSNTMELIIDDAKNKNLQFHIHFMVYYTQNINQIELNKFKTRILKIRDYVTVVEFSEYMLQNVWMAILNRNSMLNIENYRHYAFINGQNSLINLLFNYYKKAQLQIDILKSKGKYAKKV